MGGMRRPNKNVSFWGSYSTNGTFAECPRSMKFRGARALVSVVSGRDTMRSVTRRQSHTSVLSQDSLSTTALHLKTPLFSGGGKIGTLALHYAIC
jgi:hypothetical protein